MTINLAETSPLNLSHTTKPLSLTGRPKIKKLTLLTPGKNMDMRKVFDTLKPGRVHKPCHLPLVFWPVCQDEMMSMLSGRKDMCAVGWGRARGHVVVRAPVDCGVLSWSSWFNARETPKSVSSDLARHRRVY